MLLLLLLLLLLLEDHPRFPKAIFIQVIGQEKTTNPGSQVQKNYGR